MPTDLLPSKDITTFPLLPLRDVVVFPHMVIPLFVGRPKSIKALDVAMEHSKHILLVAQRSAAKDEPAASDLYSVGSVATVLQMLKLPDGTVKVLVEGTQRAQIEQVDESGEYLKAEAALLPGADGGTHEIEAMRRALLSQFNQYVKLNKKIPPESLTSMSGIDDGGRLADAIAAHLPLKLEQKQEILEMQDVGKRLEHLLGLLEGEVDILQVEKRIRGRVKRQMEKSQREYYLNEQVKAIQKELGEGDEAADLDETEKKIKAAKMSKEAEIRGHRRTYIGSMPGKILQNMTKVTVRNPLFLLDEVDKMGMDFRGDPSSALLEVLDPEQNNTFVDHYVEVEYDLSDVMFVATANNMNIPAPLLDRMEVIRLSGYTEDEKIAIARQYLLPKQMKNNGIRPEELHVAESALRDIVRYYTREAGVRNLERDISKICRKVVKSLLLKESEGKVRRAKGPVDINSKNLDKYLGVRRFTYGIAERKNQVGQVTGLAWTEVGGDLLTIEAVSLPGKGKATTTGKLGEVMK